MSRPEQVRRIIEPHALAYDGFRWHGRAFDHERREFRDFVLGRIKSPRPGAPAHSTPESDSEWNHWVALRIAPHPSLAPAQARAIRLDYGIAGEARALHVRQALLFYALKRLGLDIEHDARPPQEQHVVLTNREEVMRLVSREPEL